MFCVECGTEVGDALTSTGLCHTCFLKKNRFTTLPQHVDFEVCVHCRARRRGEIWVDPPGGGERIESVVEGGVLEAVAVDKRASGVATRATIVPEDARNFSVSVEASGVAEGVPFEESSTTRARLKNATCTRCSRMMGNYYEGVVQVRAENREVDAEELKAIRAVASRVIDKIVDEGDRNAFVLKDSANEGGLDIYVGTINSGRQIGKAISSEMGGRMREHPKIAGQKDGLEIWRVTFAIRLPEYRARDVIVLRDEPLYVQSMSMKAVTLRDLVTGHQRTIDHDQLEKGVVLRRSEAREAVVVSQSDKEAQVLDPWTFATVPVLKPAGVATFGDAVPVLKWDGALIALPP